MRLTAIFLICASGMAQTCQTTGDAPGSFDYYLLSLSWKPAFCAQHAASRDECRDRAELGFVVHGLWPQNSTGRSPELCGTPGSVRAGDSTPVMGLMFGLSLIQHEWTCHGSCSNLKPADYFALVAKDRKMVQIPAVFTRVPTALTMSAAQIASAFASANRAPPSAFRVDCQSGELVEIRACFSKTLGILQQCSNSLPGCKQKSLMIRPMK
ncbi:MAG: ribonuclease T [Terriglobia bacterium]